MITLNYLFKLNQINLSDELLENNHEMLKSMFNSEPVINLFTLFDNKFQIIESRAFLDLYSSCNEIPINLINTYFLPCHIQYIYIINISENKYYIYIYNYDSSPVMDRTPLYCIHYITELDELAFIFNLMGLKIKGFKPLKELKYMYQNYKSFKNMLYLGINNIGLYSKLIEYIHNDAHMILYDIDKSVYIKEN